MWLSIIIAIETLALIILTVKLLKKEKTEVTSALETTKGAVETSKKLAGILEKVPIFLDPKTPLIIPKEDIKKVEEVTPLMHEIRGLINPNFLIKLGNVEYTAGNLRKALTYFNEALEQAKSTEDFMTMAACLGNIGLIYSGKGESDTALKYLQDALKILIEFKLVYGKDILVNAIKELETHK